MRIRLALVSALMVLATVSSAHAAGKSAKAKNSPPPVPNPLSVSPSIVKPGKMLHITGKNFGANKNVRIIIGCPLWDAKHKPVVTMNIKANSSGKFSKNWKALASKKGKLCNVYAENLKTDAWDAVGFNIAK